MDDLPTLNSLLHEGKKKKRPPRHSRIRLLLALLTGTILAALLTFLVISRPAPAPDVTGNWHGTLTQEPGGITTVYRFSIAFTQQETSITGVTRIWLPDNPSEYGLMGMSGTINNGVIHFTETSILKQKLDSNWRWCMKTADLVVQENTLTGTWTAPDCAPGTIQVTLNNDGEGG
jgi:hypothetical protein